MTYYVSSGTLNPTHSLSQPVYSAVLCVVIVVAVQRLCFLRD